MPATKQAPVAMPAWAQELAEQLLAIYPHALRENGAWRKPGKTVVCRRLLPVLRSLEHGARQALAAEIVNAAKAEAAAAPALDDRERRFVKGLDVWINQRCWESPPEFAVTSSPKAGPALAAAKERNKLEEVRREAERMEVVIADQGPLEHLVRRLNGLRAKLGELPKFTQAAGADASSVGDLVAAVVRRRPNRT